ncbi:MAG: hypothetical protein WDA10_13705 [Porticoccaceae bacterium]|jgi:hypothetical protein|nr:hypothetical protein [Porticoccaceae bacterium]MEA3299004.1 hypothetical protein [Pseudomonadota bacterium]HLS97464.1 hypothetical protein [Porticoccaceae bacterium]
MAGLAGTVAGGGFPRRCKYIPETCDGGVLSPMVLETTALHRQPPPPLPTFS